MKNTQQLLKRIKKLQKRLLQDVPVEKCSIVYASTLQAFRKKFRKNREIISSYWALNRLEDYLKEVEIFTSQFRRPKSRDALNGSRWSMNKSGGDQGNRDSTVEDSPACPPATNTFKSDRRTEKLSVKLENIMNNNERSRSDAPTSFVVASPFRPPLPTYTPPSIPPPPPLPFLPPPSSPPSILFSSEGTPSPARIPCEPSSWQPPVYTQLVNLPDRQRLVQPQYGQTLGQYQFHESMLKQPSHLDQSFGQSRQYSGGGLEQLNHLNLSGGTPSIWFHYRSSNRTRYRPRLRCQPQFDVSLVNVSKSDRIDVDRSPCETVSSFHGDGSSQSGRERFTSNVLVVVMEDIAEGMKSLTLCRRYWIRSSARGNYLSCNHAWNRGRNVATSGASSSPSQSGYGRSMFPREQSPWQPQFLKRMPIKSLISRLQRLRKEQQCSERARINRLSNPPDQSTSNPESRRQRPQFDYRYGEIFVTGNGYSEWQESGNSRPNLRTSGVSVDRPARRIDARRKRYRAGKCLHDRLVTAYAFDNMEKVKRRIKSSTEMYSPLENLYGNVKTVGGWNTRYKIPKIIKSTKTKVTTANRHARNLTESIRSKPNSDVTSERNLSLPATLPERRSSILGAKNCNNAMSSEVVSNRISDPNIQKNMPSENNQDVLNSPGSTIVANFDLDDSGDEVAVKTPQKPKKLNESERLQRDAGIWCGTNSALSGMRPARACRNKPQFTFEESPLEEKARFECTICRKRFKSIVGMRSHKTKMHKCSISNVSQRRKRRTEIERMHSHARKKNVLPVINQKWKENWLQPKILLKKIDCSWVEEKVSETSEDCVEQKDIEVSVVDNVLSQMSVSLLDNMLSNFNDSCISEVANDSDFDMGEFLKFPS